MNKRFEALDSFRGLAALFVVIHHMYYLGSITEWSFFRHSALFVEFFFILSGFVLSHSYAYKKEIYFKDYVISRTFRIFPLHLVVLSAFILLELLKLWITQNSQSLKIVTFENNMAISEILPNILLLQAWLPNASNISYNPPAWSISIEYYMYMIFFTTLLFKPPFKTMSWILISLSMFTLSVIQYDNIDDVIIRGLSSFFLGTLVYRAYKLFESKVSMNSSYFTLLEMMLLISVCYVVSSNIVYQSIIVNILFAITVWVFAFEKGFISFFLRYKIFLYFGKLSYSIYMIHVFIIFSFYWMIRLTEKLFNVHLTPIVKNTLYIDLGSSFYNNILVGCLIGLIVLVSHFTYKYIEQKGQLIGSKLRTRKTNK